MPCKQKDKARATLPNRTGGWHFVLDAEGGAVLGALEHIDNENNTDKHRVLAAVMEDPDVDPDALVHDGNIAITLCSASARVHRVSAACR